MWFGAVFSLTLSVARPPLDLHRKEIFVNEILFRHFHVSRYLRYASSDVVFTSPEVGVWCCGCDTKDTDTQVWNVLLCRRTLRLSIPVAAIERLRVRLCMTAEFSVEVNCMCTCTHMRARVHSHSHIHTNIHTHTHIHTHTFTHAHIQTHMSTHKDTRTRTCLLYTSPSPRDFCRSRMPSSA